MYMHGIKQIMAVRVKTILFATVSMRGMLYFYML
jgi:hypothetical protein